MSNTQNPTLPDHLILDHILPRLPIKPLIRFKSVSKIWQTYISSPAFAKTHFSLSNTSPQFLLFTSTKVKTADQDCCFSLLPYDACNNVITDLVELDCLYGLLHDIDFLGSCNGLACLYLQPWDFTTTPFVVWNPATREYRYVGYPEGQDCSNARGFGYVESTDDCVIVASFFSRGEGETKDDWDWGYFYVFSLKGSEWKRVSCLDKYFDGKFELDYRLVFVGDCVYCPFVCIEDWEEAGRVVGYNVVTEEFKEIPWVNLLSGYSYACPSKMRGRLALHCEVNGVSHVWSLKKDGDWNSWEKVFSIDLGKVFFYEFFETGLCLVKDVGGEGQLKVIDPSKEASEQSQQGFGFDRYIMRAVEHVESLISPFGVAKSYKAEDDYMNCSVNFPKELTMSSTLPRSQTTGNESD